jgi:hypothetical protein
MLDDMGADDSAPAAADGGGLQEGARGRVGTPVEWKLLEGVWGVARGAAGAAGEDLVGLAGREAPTPHCTRMHTGCSTCV